MTSISTLEERALADPEDDRSDDEDQNRDEHQDERQRERHARLRGRLLGPHRPVLPRLARLHLQDARNRVAPLFGLGDRAHELEHHFDGDARRELFERMTPGPTGTQLVEDPPELLDERVVRVARLLHHLPNGPREVEAGAHRERDEVDAAGQAATDPFLAPARLARHEQVRECAPEQGEREHDHEAHLEGMARGHADDERDEERQDRERDVLRGREPQVVTGVDQPAIERIGLTAREYAAQPLTEPADRGLELAPQGVLQRPLPLEAANAERPRRARGRAEDDVDERREAPARHEDDQPSNDRERDAGPVRGRHMSTARIWRATAVDPPQQPKATIVASVPENDSESTSKYPGLTALKPSMRRSGK